jgi:hypothetical protein
MITSCPHCASEVDTAEAMCPACGWSVPYLVRRSPTAGHEASFSERYRGTPYQSPDSLAVLNDGSVARGRVFVAVAMTATLSLFGLIILSQPHP